MAEGRFRCPKAIEEEELCVERAVPKSTRYKNKWAVGIFEDWQRVRSVKSPILEVGGVFKEYELESSTVSATISVDSSSESVSRKVEKVSQNVDMDTMPVCFGDFKKCTVNFNFK